MVMLKPATRQRMQKESRFIKTTELDLGRATLARRPCKGISGSISRYTSCSATSSVPADRHTLKQFYTMVGPERSERSKVLPHDTRPWHGHRHQLRSTPLEKPPHSAFPSIWRTVPCLVPRIWVDFEPGFQQRERQS